MAQPNVDERTLSLFIKDQDRDLSARKSIKVKLPIRQHIRLHALKLFTANNISETVEMALDQYFEGMAEESGAAAEAVGELGAPPGPPVGVE